MALFNYNVSSNRFAIRKDLDMSTDNGITKEFLEKEQEYAKGVPFTNADDIDKEVCEKYVPSGYNILRWVKEHPDRSISQSFKRIENIFDEYDEVLVSFSGGKDSTLSSEMAMLELNRRKARCAAMIDRHGNKITKKAIGEYEKAVKNGYKAAFKIREAKKDSLRDIGEFVESSNQNEDTTNYSEDDKKFKIVAEFLAYDKKWENKKVTMLSQDCEWIFTDAILHGERFFKLHGQRKFNCNFDERGFVFGDEIIKTDKGIFTAKEIYDGVTNGEVYRLSYHCGKVVDKNNFTEAEDSGEDSLNLFYKCLPLGWTNGVCQGDTRLTSWDESKKDMWIRPMPTKESMGGFDIITMDNISRCNLVPLNSLDEATRNKRIEEDSVITIEDEITMMSRDFVPHFGCGNKSVKLTGFDIDIDVWCWDGLDEDLEQNLFTDFYLSSFPEGTKVANLVSLRSAESFDRFSILKQSDYRTGHYATKTAGKVNIN